MLVSKAELSASTTSRHVAFFASRTIAFLVPEILISAHAPFKDEHHASAASITQSSRHPSPPIQIGGDGSYWWPPSLRRVVTRFLSDVWQLTAPDRHWCCRRAGCRHRMR